LTNLHAILSSVGHKDICRTLFVHIVKVNGVQNDIGWTPFNVIALANQNLKIVHFRWRNPVTSTGLHLIGNFTWGRKISQRVQVGHDSCGFVMLFNNKKNALFESDFCASNIATLLTFYAFSKMW